MDAKRLPFSGSEEDYPSVLGASDQIQVSNGGKKIIKSAAINRGKTFKAAMAKGGKKFANAMVKGGKKSWAAVVRGGKIFGPSCFSGCASGGIQATVDVATV